MEAPPPLPPRMKKEPTPPPLPVRNMNQRMDGPNESGSNTTLVTNTGPLNNNFFADSMNSFLNRTRKLFKPIGHQSYKYKRIE